MERHPSRDPPLGHEQERLAAENREPLAWGQGRYDSVAMTRSLRQESRFSDFHTWLLLELTRETSDRGESFLPGLHVLVSISLRGADMDMHDEWGDEWGAEWSGSAGGILLASLVDRWSHRHEGGGLLLFTRL